MPAVAKETEENRHPIQAHTMLQRLHVIDTARAHQRVVCTRMWYGTIRVFMCAACMCVRANAMRACAENVYNYTYACTYCCSGSGSERTWPAWQTRAHDRQQPCPRSATRPHVRQCTNCCVWNLCVRSSDQFGSVPRKRPGTSKQDGQAARSTRRPYLGPVAL